ncbi:20178_t:CDS:2, partial [Gigaspora rosea]
NLSHLIPSSEPDEIHFEQKKNNANYKSKSEDEQKRYDQESLKSDLDEMSEFLKLFSENDQSDLWFIQGSLNILHLEVSLIETQFCHPKVKEPIDTDTQISAPRIDPKFLIDISNKEKPIKTIANSSNIMVVKKFYTEYAIEVSCEILTVEPRKFQSKKKQRYLAILGKLEKSWAHIPDERISISKLYIMLSNMQKKYVPTGYTPDILRISGLSDEEDLYMSEDEDIKEANEIEEILE